MSDEHIKVLRDMQLLRGHKHSDRDKHAALDAAIAALGGGWLPIESAPRDGTQVLVYEDGEYHVTEWCTFTDGFGEKHTGWIHPDKGELGPYTFDPTHWMPLPAPPSKEG